MQDIERYLNLRDRYIESRFLALNDAQRVAALHTQGPELILAGAGSGKTTVLINRIINLLKFGTAYKNLRYSDEFLNDSVLRELDAWGINGCSSKIQLSAETERCISLDVPKPCNILAITFTNKAANELKTRIAKAVGEDLAKDMQASTFHSLCARILRTEYKSTEFSSHFTIYDTDDSKRLLKDIIKEKFDSDVNIDVSTALDYISSFKDKLETVEYIDEQMQIMDTNGIQYKYLSLYKDYQKALKQADAMDFGDLVMNTVNLLKGNEAIKNKYSNRYKYILVDEYQDINKAQQTLIDILASNWFNICAVGDEDQSIYGFRGASVDYILSFPDRYPSVYKVKLEQNYRSTKNIVGLANSVIQNNRGRFDKKLWTDNNVGDKVKIVENESSDSEAEYIVNQIKSMGLVPKETAILYRMNSQSSSIEQLLMKHKIPYRIIGGLRFFDRKEVKDILAYLHILVNHSDSVRLKRIINTPARKIGNTTIEKLELAASKEKISMIEVCKDIDKLGKTYGLSRNIKSLKDFYNLYTKLKADVDKTSLPDLIHYVYKSIGYDDYLDSMSGADDRKLNINKLEELASKYEAEHTDAKLIDFLEEISLVADVDSYDKNADVVTMMTIHSSKGLEFKNVFLVGWADGIFPSMRALQCDDIEGAIEEERRLAYVAITRAMKNLFITWADNIYLWGNYKGYKPSRFIGEFDKRFILESTANTQTQKDIKSYKSKSTSEKNEYTFSLQVGSKVIDRNHRVYTVESFISAGNCHIVNLRDSFGQTTRVIWEYANMIIK